ILPPLVVAFLLAPLAPLPLIGLAILVSFISILVLLPPLIEPLFHLPLYCLMGVYLFNAVLSWITLSSAAKREVQFLGVSLAVVIFAYLFRPQRVAKAEKRDDRHRLLVFGSRVALAVLALAQVANLFGYFKLSQYLTALCIYSTFIALAVFTALRVFNLLLLAGMEAPWAERLAMVRLHRTAIARWAPRVMQTAGALIWLRGDAGANGRAPVDQPADRCPARLQHRRRLRQHHVGSRARFLGDPGGRVCIL